MSSLYERMHGRPTPNDLKKAQEQNDRAFEKAAQAVNAAALMASGGRMPTSSWSFSGNNPLSLANANLASAFGKPSEAVELAMARQGMSWGPPFSPGRPLDPFWGYRRPPRTRDYVPGENVQITPRWNRISYATLDQLWKQYDVAQICTQHLINDVRSLDYHFEAQLGIRDDVAEDIRTARIFFESPDKRQPFRAWLAEYLTDVIKFDAGALHIRRNLGGEPIALEVVSGPTIIPLSDYFGRIATDEDDDAEDEELTPAGLFEGKITPAYTQIVQGMPWVQLAFDDLIYQPWNPQPDSMYGRAPLEAVLMSANTDLRFQWHFLQYFTEGTIPAGFMEAPPDLSDPTQIAEWQETWDALMMGDQAKLRQIRWVPAGAKFVNVKASADNFQSEFPLYLMRRVCAAYGVTPTDLGFTETVNKATSETQVDVQFRVGTLPLVRHVEDVINLFLAEDLKLKVRLRFDTGREVEDRLATAQAEKIYIEAGVLSPDEPRTRMGYPIDRNRPAPRIMNNPRQGPIPLIAIQSIAGETDPETFGPTPGVPLLDHPFVPPPGPAPIAGTPEGKAANEASAEMQRDMLSQATGKPRGSTAADQVVAADRAARAKPDPNEDPPKVKKPSKASVGKAVARAAQRALADFQAELAKAGMTAGVTAATGVHGADLDDGVKELVPGDDDVVTALRQWRENSRNRLRKGLEPRMFRSEVLPVALQYAVWAKLQSARNRGEVDRAFIDPLRPASKAKAKPVKAAGIAVLAKDSGRVLLIQRDNDDPDKASSGKWEFPGGRLDEGEQPWDAALREWQEETGLQLPKGKRVNQWAQDDYVGFVYVIPKEDALTLNPDQQARDVIDPDHPHDEQGEVTSWWEIKDAEDNDALRDEFKDFDWSLLEDEQ